MEITHWLLPVEACLGAGAGAGMFRLAKHFNLSRPLALAMLAGAVTVAGYTSLVQRLTWRAEDEYLRRDFEIRRAASSSGTPPATSARNPAADPVDGIDASDLERTDQ